ncbi:MAG: S16 family serine protease [Candidatus Woesearchaeota archaeon]
MKWLVLVVILVLLALPSALAVSGKIPLLTVSDADTDIGGIASLQLDIQPGTGRIFIDSFPLSRLDTQISVRFANQIACDLSKVDCSKYDFFYTIRSDSAVVGGPSAGSAMAVLTVSLLEGVPLDTKTVMTGTINSGATIGPVGGIPGKVKAAEQAGFTHILIPEFSEANMTNLTKDGISITKVSTLEDALKIFTGMDFGVTNGTLSVPIEYAETMRVVALKLCNRSAYLQSIITTENETLQNRSASDLNRSIAAFERGDNYAAASSCFSANLALRTWELQGDTQQQLNRKMVLVSEAIRDIEAKTSTVKISTLSDFETYAIVQDRVLESRQVLAKINASNVSVPDLAYVFERYQSGVAWSSFFGLPGKSFSLDPVHTRSACLKRLEEAEERYNYLDLYAQGTLSNYRTTLDRAYTDFRNKEFALCVFEASKAKAEINTVLSGLFVNASDINALVSVKINQAEKVLLKEQEKGLFSIMGYSYYEYARFLNQTDPASALTFAEYAIELSNLDTYFTREDGVQLKEMQDSKGLSLFFAGFFVGVLILMPFIIRRDSEQKQKKKPAKKTSSRR